MLLLVDAAEGPMPQTRFVLDKALALGLKIIVVVNKVDRPDARAKEVLDEVLELFMDLNATDEQINFPVLYASGRDGWATDDLDNGSRDSIVPLMDAMIDHIPPPPVQEGAVQMQISTLDYNDYVGRIGIGRVNRGVLNLNEPLVLIKRDGRTVNANIKQIFTFQGIERKDVDCVECGDLCAVVGIEGIDISDTIASAEQPEAMPPIAVDEPTLSMMFRVNDSPFFGRDGKFISSRHIRERLFKEAERDVAIRIEDTGTDAFNVSGRGILHLSVLIENMRREGFELAVSRPKVIFREIDGRKQEPYENVTLDVEEQHQGSVMQALGERKGDLKNMNPDGKGRVRLDYVIPSRGLIGFRSEFMTMTSGTGLLYSTFSHYDDVRPGEVGQRQNGVLISNGQGKAVAFALFGLQDRGKLFLGHGAEVYEGQIIGIHSRSNDLTVNCLTGKKLTNMRASGTDEAVVLVPPIRMTLEQALEFIDDDELVEVTPTSIRIRKRHLTENDRRRANRAPKDD